MAVAVVQMDVKILEKARNLEKISDHLNIAAQHGARIVIFPECALTGYCYESLDEARIVAEPVPGPSTEIIAKHASRLGCTVIVGLLEIGENTFHPSGYPNEDRLQRSNDVLVSPQGSPADTPHCQAQPAKEETKEAPIFNAAAIISPDGILGTHRKIHLPCVGVDRYIAPGSRPFRVFPAPQGKVGVNICYDCSFPESGRVVKLRGAQLLAIPTNWPLGCGTWKHTCCVRATENHMFVAAADRVGEERGFRFDGHSQIVGATGNVLAEANETEETILYANIDLAAADNNHLVYIPGVYEIHRLADRRPEMYGAITEAPGQVID